MISSDAVLQERLEAILARPPIGLLLDIDGTISPIAPTPEAAEVPDTLRALLRRLAARLAVVAAVSGRAATDAARMVGVPEMVYAGNHGFELLRAGRIEPLPEAARYREPIEHVLAQARLELPIAGLIFEDKGLTASVHYRLAEDPTAAGAHAHEVLRRLAAEHGLRLTAGRMVWELRPPLAVNKGTAVRRLVDTFGLNSVVFGGDDRTDVDAFRMLEESRTTHNLTVLNAGVVAAETPPEVLEHADVLVDGVPGMERLLELFARLARA